MLCLKDKVILLYENPEKFDEWLADMMRAVGGEVVREGDYCWLLRFRITGAVCRNIDPINNLVMLALVFFGEYGMYLPDADEAFRELKKWWKEQIAKEKEQT